MTDRTMKQGDTYKPLVVELGSTDPGFDLTDAVSVTLRMRRQDQAVYVTGTMVVQDASTATYDWEAADTAEAGTYDVEVEVDWGLGRIETFPNDGYAQVVLDEELDAPTP